MKGVDRIKKFFGPINVDKQLFFWKYNCFLFLDLAPNGFLPLLGLHQDILRVRVRFKNFIVTDLCRLSTFIFEVQS